MPPAAATAALTERAGSASASEPVGRPRGRATLPWQAGWDGHDLAFVWPPTGDTVAGVTATTIGLFTLPRARPLHDVAVSGVAALAWASDATQLVAVTRAFQAFLVNVPAAAAGLPPPRAVRRVLAGVDIQAAAFAPPPADHLVLQAGSSFHVVGRDGRLRRCLSAPSPLTRDAWLHVPAGGPFGLIGVQPWRFDPSPFALIDLGRCDLRVARCPASPVVVLAPSGSRYAAQAETPSDAFTAAPRRRISVREAAGDAVLFAVTTTHWASAMSFSTGDHLAVVAAGSCRVYAPGGVLRYREEFAAHTVTWARHATAVAFVGQDSFTHVDLTLPTARAQRLQWRGLALVSVALAPDGGTAALVTSACGHGGRGASVPPWQRGAEGQTLRIVDLTHLTTRLTAALTPVTFGHTALHWSPDGRRLALEQRRASAATASPSTGPAASLAAAAGLPRDEVTLFELG